MHRNLSWPAAALFLATIALAFAASLPAARGDDAPAIAELPPWEGAIRLFELADQRRPPQPGGVLFLGSSSIRMWDLAKAFPGAKVLNRGFGGSQIADSVAYVDRIVFPCRPRLVVFYAGDNDIAAGKSAERVAADFQELTGRIFAKLPETKITFLAVKPSPSRWKFIETQRRANQLIADFIRTDDRLAYIDVVTPMLNDKGEPRGELFLKDNLHMNAAGYAIWNDLVRTLVTP